MQSALAFTEALKEREGQIELRRLKKLNAVDYDKAMIENWQKINDEGMNIAKCCTTTYCTSNFFYFLLLC